MYNSYYKKIYLAFVKLLAGPSILLETSMNDEANAHYVLKFSLMLLFTYNTFVLKYSIVPEKIFLQ
jgi:hypothetical protein